MSYTPPCLKDLYDLAKQLQQKYTDVNPNRISFMALYDTLVKQVQLNAKLNDQDRMNILTGAMVFMMTDIKFIEYKGSSPKKREGYFWSSGSDFYSLIRSKMLITKTNKFGYDERLFYLNEFFKYVDANYTDQHVADIQLHPKMEANSAKSKWSSKQALRNHIHDMITPILNKNSEDRYNLVHGVPVINALIKSMGKLEQDYALKSYNPTNPVRLESLNCIKFILLSYQMANQEDVSWHVCSGALLMPILQIDKEYQYFFSATRSTLYTECLRALNQSDINKITIDDKVKWLRSLSSYLHNLSQNQNKYNWVLKQVIANTKNQTLDAETLHKQIMAHQSKIELFLAELDVKKNTPSYTTAIIETGTSYAFQYATGQYFVETAKNLVVGGLIGTAIFGTAGTFLVTGLGRFVTEGVINTATAGLFGWVLGKIGASVGTVTATVVTYPFSATPKGLEEMRMKLKPVDDVAFVRMVNTLLELDGVNDEDKKHIRLFLGLEVDEKLQPLKSSLILDPEEKKIRDAVMMEGHAARFLTEVTSDAEIDEEEASVKTGLQIKK